MNDIIDKLYESIDSWYNRGFVDAIVILGGEPLDNSDDELSEFVSLLKSRYPDSKLWVYTHFEINEVEKSHPKTLRLLDYIKCGSFDESKFSIKGFKDEPTGVILATSNQYIINVKEAYHV